MKWLMVALIVGSTVLADLLQSFEMKRRGIRREELERVIRNPEQVVPSKKGRQIYPIPNWRRA